MRRWTLWTLAIVMLGLTASLMALATPARLARLTAGTASAVFRATEHGLANALRERVASRIGMVRALECVTAAAQADEVLQFKPISPESAARYTARARRARAAASATIARRSAPSPDTLTPLPAETEPAGEPTPPIPPTRHAGEMMRIGSDIHVEKDQTVEGDVVAISGDVHVDGHVKGSVQSLGGDIYLGSTARVDGDVAAVKGELHEEPGAYVGGQKVTALSRRPVRIGHRHMMDPEDLVAKPLRELWRFGRTLAWLLVMLGLVWLILRIAPGRTNVAVEVLRRETAASLGIGLLTIVLVVPSIVALALVVAILCITIIGIPVAIAALLAYGVLLMVLLFWGNVVGAAWLGGQLRGAFPGGSTLRHALIGTIGIIGLRALGHLIGMLPFFGFAGGFLVVVGWILSSTVSTLGVGALLRSEFASGHLGRWWRGWRGSGTPGSGAPGAGPIPVAPAPGVPAGPAPTSIATLPASPPPWPPASYAPPASGETGPGPSEPGPGAPGAPAV